MMRASILLILTTMATTLSARCPRTLKFQPYQETNRTLVSHVVERLSVDLDQTCRVKCFLNHDCVSYNLGPSPTPGLLLCELNNADRYQYPQDYQDKPGFFYTGIRPNPCTSGPCKNNGTCQTGFAKKGYRCLCTRNYTGENCEKTWKKANSAPVCIGAKNDAFGSFTAPLTGKIQIIKLVHLSGGVAWGGGSRYEGNWGDSFSKKFEIHVTFANRTRLAPPANYKYRYSLPGQDFNGKTLVYPAFSPYLPVQVGQVFKVWYGDDLRNHKEHDNSGTVCADVHLLYV